MNAIVETQAPSVMLDMASRFGMDKRAFESTLMATVMPCDKNGALPSREHVAAFLLVAKKYALNPFTKEIYAFPAKGGGIQPVVSVDGWMKIINDHPQFDGMDFEDNFDEAGKLSSITCRVHRKDRTHPVEVTEYMAECKRDTEPWRKWPARMLRHKAAIQAARYAFGFSGIMEPDEAERAAPAPLASLAPVAAQPFPSDRFNTVLPSVFASVKSGKRTVEEAVRMLSAKGILSEEQRCAIADACALEKEDAPNETA